MIERNDGIEFQWHSFRIFFGNKESQLTNLKQADPKLQFLRMKQVHGNHIVEVNSQTEDFVIEADGHISNEANLALCSISADCVPVLIAAADCGWFGALHAGWRGVASRIVPRAIHRLKTKGAAGAELRIWIGPHILQESFEVETDVRDLILQSLPPGPVNPELDPADWSSAPRLPKSASLYYYEDERGKSFVNLVQVLLEQIAAVGVPLSNVELELDDTMTNSQFHSARRDRQNSGRQISWIAKL